MSKNKPFLILVLFIGFFSSITYWIGYNSNSNIEKSNINQWPNVNFILNHLISNYVDSIDKNELAKKSISNILKDLDPHSTYIPSEKRESVNETLVGHFGGVGIRFMILRDTLTVVDVIDGGPSFKIGLKKRDRIIKIDGQNITKIGISNELVLKKLKGPFGTNVNIDILNTNKEIENKNITRGLIPLKSIVACDKIEDGIGYIKISTFSNNTDLELKDALLSLNLKKIKGIILDLRFNGGGYLHQAINVADEFLPKNKLIVYTKGAHTKKQTYYAKKNGLYEKGKLIILVNSGTASASEIVSGAIQDHKRGIIIGRRTFGKGLVQQPVLLPDSSELRITTSRYYTPSGKCIQKPYGDSIDYENDIFERLENGELTEQDTIGKSLSKKGGIWPDIFSPIDTLNYNEIVSRITFSRNWRDFCFDYFDKNPNKPYDKLFDFYKSFKIDKTFIIDYFKKNKLNLDDLNNKIMVDLNRSFKLEVGNYYYGDQARYILSAYEDIDVKKAIRQIKKY